MNNLLSSQNHQADACTYSGDDRTVLNGLTESVQCQGSYLDGDYNAILTNHGAGNAVVLLSVTKNGDVVYQQTVTVVGGEPQTIPVSVP